MAKSMNILYTYKDHLYVNLTNRCPCRCEFCIRSNGDGLGSADTLWLEHDPTIDEIKDAFSAYSLDDFSELIFCGYGEPLERLDTLLDICRFVRAQSGIKIRINTNGLADLIHSKPTAHLLEGLVDTVSVSLNTPTAEEYNAICHPKFGVQSYDALIRFAQDCKQYVPNVVLSVVDIIGPEKVAACQKVADKAGIPLRVREYQDDNTK